MRLLAIENLMPRGCTLFFCDFKNDSLSHLFLECWWARIYWSKLGLIDWPEEVSKSPSDWLWFVLIEYDLKSLSKVVIGIWMI